MEAKLQLFGTAEMRRMFAHLSGRGSLRVIEHATSMAVKPIVSAAKRNARRFRRTGLLAKSIGHKTTVYRDGNIYAAIGARNGFAQTISPGPGLKPIKVNPAKYSHLVEQGTVRSAPRPFLRPAFEATKQQAEQIMATEARFKLLEIVDQERRKGGSSGRR